MTPSRLRETFGKERVLLPVIHYANLVAATTSVDVARSNGADGVWLINQGIDARQLPSLAASILRRHPGMWVGVNVLGEEPADVLASFAGRGVPVRGVWSDDGGLCMRAAPGGGPGGVRVLRSARRMDEARAARPDVLYFGGAAFKGQPEVRDADLPALAAESSLHMDVVTTSGPATGVPAPLGKVRAMAGALRPPARLGLASGVTPENVRDYLPHVHAFLVATHIEASYGVLDPAKVRAMADAIASWGAP